MSHDHAGPGPGFDDDATARPAPTEPDPALKHALETAVTMAHAELVRAGESKSGLLLSWAGAAFGLLGTLLVTSPDHFPGIARFGVIVAVMMLSVAVVLILLTIRPTLPRHGRTATALYSATTTPQDVLDRIRAQLADGELSLARQTLLLSRLALVKHRYLQWAIDLIIAAIVILTITVALTRLF
ncbi:Pycsar system effector family protein [Streptosporangium longisporum]|uniref:Pycsar effector protein domain-containing protein n=1 Tax=Streptosporangium longisporum TaxID=46187 RepID=A0ABP6KLR1_9ACTN